MSDHSARLSVSHDDHLFDELEEAFSYFEQAPTDFRQAPKALPSILGTLACFDASLAPPRGLAPRQPQPIAQTPENDSGSSQIVPSDVSSPTPPLVLEPPNQCQSLLISPATGLRDSDNSEASLSPTLSESELTLDWFESQVPYGLPWTKPRGLGPSFEELLLLPDKASRPPQDEEMENDSLYWERIERKVYELTSGGAEARNALRQVLASNPWPKARKEIHKLLQSGRTPQELLGIHRIRRRCKAVLGEFSRLVLWGKLYATGSVTTVSWSLAAQLWDAHLTSRVQLFKFFRSLCDAFECHPVLFKQYGSVLNSAKLHLRGLPIEQLVRRAAADSFRLAPREDRRRFQSMFRLCDPERMSVGGRNLRPNLRDWTAQFQPYNPVWQKSDNLHFADAAIRRFFRVISPLKLEFVKVSVEENLRPRVVWMADVLQKEGTLIPVHNDLWVREDLEYLQKGGTRCPRIPAAGYTGVALEPTDFDLGYGLLRLKLCFGSQAQPYQTAFLKRWTQRPNGIELEDIELYIERFQRLYPSFSERLTPK